MKEHKRAVIDYVMTTLSFSAMKGSASIKQLVIGVNGAGGSIFSASEVRSAMGYLYAHGRVRVVKVEDGQEFWARSGSDELAQR